MQVDGALRRGSTIPRRRRLHVLLVLAAVVVIVALVVWVIPLATSGLGSEDANPEAAEMNSAVYYPLPPGKEVANPNSGAGSAVLHDDAGNVHRNAGSAVLHDDAGNVHAD